LAFELLSAAQKGSHKEADMIFKSTLLALIVFLGSLTVAAAQSPGKSSDSETVSGGGAQFNGSDSTTRAVLGWNYTHAAYCLTLFDGSTTWFYVVAPDGSFWFTSNALFEAALAPACQTGNMIAINVFNLTGLQWNGALTLPFK
jgi:hypothetical protein